MEELSCSDLLKIKELLRNTGEFIAYFELAESKMIAWQQEIELQSRAQEQRTNQQFQILHGEVEALQEILTQAGFARLRLHLEDAMKKGEEHLTLLRLSGKQLLSELSNQHIECKQIFMKNSMLFEEHTKSTINRLEEKFAHYDVGEFYQVAHNSCEQVERVSVNTIRKSAGLLRGFQWRSIALALVTTFVSTMTLSMYISGELPWDIHDQAKNEREAGRALLKAWSFLPQQEQNKIRQQLEKNS